MKNIANIVIALSFSLGIVACGGGNVGGSGASVQPGSPWNNTGFANWKSSGNLRNYVFSATPIENYNNSLYFVGKSTESAESAIVQYNSTSSTWINLTYNLPNGGFGGAVYSNGSLFAVVGGQLYQLKNQSWNLIAGLESNYQIIQIAPTTINGIKNGLAGVLAAESGLTEYGGYRAGNYKVYTLSNAESLIDQTPNSIAIANPGGDVGGMLDTIDLSFDLNDNTNWSLTVLGYSFASGTESFNYFTSNNLNNPASIDLPMYFSLSGMSSMVGGNVFVTINNSDPTLGQSYLCSSSGCDLLNLPESSSSFGLFAYSIPEYNQATLQNGILQYNTNSISYTTESLNGNVSVWNCSIAGSVVGSCNQIGNDIAAIESPNYVSTSSIVFGMISRTINATPANLQKNTGGLDLYNYGYYIFNNSQWQDIAPSVGSIGNDAYRTSLYNTCQVGESGILALATSSNYVPVMAKQNKVKLTTLNIPYQNGGPTYFSNGNTWYNSNSPGDNVGTILGITKVSGNTITSPTSAFYSISYASGNKLAELYVNNYPQACSQTYK